MSSGLNFTRLFAGTLAYFDTYLTGYPSQEDVAKDHVLKADLWDDEELAFLEGTDDEDYQSIDSPEDVVLKEEVNIDELDEEGFAPIHYAALNGDYEAVAKLIQMGANVNLISSKSECTPLCLATVYDQPIAAEVLIAAGADVNKTDILGLSPLFYSVHNETLDIFFQLTKANAEISAIIDAAKRSLLVYVKEQQIFRYGVVSSRLKQRRREQDPKPFLYQKQWIQTKLIAHAFELRGEYLIQGHRVDGEGVSPKLVGRTLAKMTSKFAQVFPDLLNEKAASDLVTGLEYAVSSLISADDFVERIQDLEPTFIFTGFKGHVVTILIWKDLFAICNRGMGRFETATYIGRFDPLKLDSITIQDILDLQDKEEEEHYKAFCNGDESTILKKIGFKRTANEERLEQRICLRSQKVGNCALTSTQAAIDLFLFLDSLRNENFIFPLLLSKCITIETYNTGRYSMLFLFVKILLLENHITCGFNPECISKKLFYRLKKGADSIPCRFKNYMFERIKNIQGY